ncbi:MAG: hypothetical protein D6805_00130 [Planctomycetota bacterium]|nr:MAG: hypothetical protein D6805_00130 [Planctomycetota bacterium]
MPQQEYIEPVKITTEEVHLTIVGEPYVRYTHRGYAPVVNVKVNEKEKKVLFISSASLAAGLQPLVEKQNGKFDGIQIKVRKESNDRFAKYLVTPVTDE